MISTVAHTQISVIYHVIIYSNMSASTLFQFTPLLSLIYHSIESYNILWFSALFSVISFIRSSAALFEVQRFWARNMSPPAATDGDGSGAVRSEKSEKSLRARASSIISRNIRSFKKTDNGTSTGSDPLAESENTRSSLMPSVHARGESTSPLRESTPKPISQLSYIDAMTTLVKRDRERLQDKSWVLIPVLADTEPCRRCGQLFDADENDSNACAFHADKDGKPGEYTRVAVKNGKYYEAGAPISFVKMWTCCHRSEEHAPGCFSRPHICKDVMVSVRALGSPTVRIENIEMSVLRALEISIFPGAMTSWLQVRITRQLADVLHNYFSIDAASNSEIQDSTVPTASKEKATEGPGSPPSDSQQAPTTAPAEKLSTRNRMMNYLTSKVTAEKSDSTVNSADKSSKHKAKDSGKDKDRDKDKDLLKEKDIKNEKGRDRAMTAVPASSGIIYSGTTGPGGRQEGVYIRYLRVGDIQVDLSLSGFPLNVENYRAVVEPFFCRSEVLLSWQRLIYSFERHASRSLIRNTASSSLTRLSNFFSFSGAPRPDGVVTTGDKIVDVIKRTTGTRSAPADVRPNAHDEEKKKIAMLLGGASL